MKVLFPMTVTESQFVSSTVPEDDHPAWSAATAYSIGDRVIVLANHSVYEAVTPSTNKPPATSPNDWLRVGATNRWRMFDETIGSRTEADEGLTVEVAPGEIVSSVALVNVDASSVRVTMTDDTEGVVFDRTELLYDPSNVVDWWTYFFERIERKSTHVINNLPTYGSATIAVELIGADVALGSLVLGRLREYTRLVQRGVSVGIQDYSRRERDEWGNTIISERAFAKRAEWRFVIDNASIDSMQRQLAELRARPAIYVGSTRYEATVIYGFYRDFRIVIAHPGHAECSIEIEGLT